MDGKLILNQGSLVVRFLYRLDWVVFSENLKCTQTIFMSVRKMIRIAEF